MTAVHERETVKFWEAERLASEAYLAPVLEKFQLYSQWFAGNMTALTSEIASQFGLTMPLGAPFLNLVTRTSRAEMFYRSPRFLVEPIEKFGPSVFTPDLAAVETVLLNDCLDETNFFQAGRKTLLDMLLAHRGIFKLGYSADVGIDHSVVNDARLVANGEDQKLIVGSRKSTVKREHVHTVHIEAHQQVLAACERGDMELDDKRKKWLREHIIAHQKYLDTWGERPKEHIRYQHVWIKRTNPMRFRFDPWAENQNERTWVAEIFVRDINDVRQDEKYRADVRANLKPMDVNSIHGLDRDTRYARLTGEGHTDNRIGLVEVIDLKRRKVITYAINHMDAPLRVTDYVMADIWPDGPYVDRAFNEHPIEDQGIPQPQVYEEFQKALAVIDSIIMEISKRNIPKNAIDASAMSETEYANYRKAAPGSDIVFSELGHGNKTIKDVFQPIPVTQIDQMMLQIRSLFVRSIEQYSGLGSAKLAGGDRAKTATASAIIGESVATLTEDLNSVIDEMMGMVGKKALRAMRLFYDQAKVGEIVGQKASQDTWPTDWSIRDISFDRGVQMVPGSTRRKNIATEQKLFIELYSILANDPALPPASRVEMLKRMLDSVGMFGVDLTGAQEAIMQQQLQEAQAQAQEGASGPKAGSPGDRPGRRAKGGTAAPTAAGQASGVNNVSGGRVSSGGPKKDTPASGVAKRRSSAMKRTMKRG